MECGKLVTSAALAVQPQVIGDLLIGFVHHHYRHLSIRIEKGSGKQRASAWRAGDSLRARADKLRKVSDVVIRVRVNQLARLRIGVNRGEAEILDVIRPASFIQQYVPVRPADSAAVEVIDHRASVQFAQFPVLELFGIEGIGAAFGEDQVLVGKGLVHELDVVEHRVAAAPWLVPVITNAPHILRGFGVRQDRAGPLIDEIAVVIPGDDLLVAEPFASSSSGRDSFSESLARLRRSRCTTPIFCVAIGSF